LIAIAQQINEPILTNADVIEMVKSGLSDSVITAKIKRSKGNFDTTTGSLAKLKEVGVSDAIVIAMIGNPEAVKDGKNIILNNTLIDIKNVIEKNRVFVDCADDKAKQEILQILNRNGFSVVSELSGAELLVKLTSSSISRTMGIGGSIVMTNTEEVEMGKLAVYLLTEKEGKLVFSKEKRTTFPAKYLYTQAKNYMEDFIEALRKAEKKKN
jgi:ribosomal protein S8